MFWTSAENCWVPSEVMLAFEGLTVICGVTFGLNVGEPLDCESTPQPLQTASAAMIRRNPVRRNGDVNDSLPQGNANVLNILASHEKVGGDKCVRVLSL
jgi:hypothetical protein